MESSGYQGAAGFSSEAVMRARQELQAARGFDRPSLDGPPIGMALQDCLKTVHALSNALDELAVKLECVSVGNAPRKQVSEGPGAGTIGPISNVEMALLEIRQGTERCIERVSDMRLALRV